MRHRTQTLIEASWVMLQSSTNPKTGRKHYTIRLLRLPVTGQPYSPISEIRELFDPGRNRGSAIGTTWKYQRRSTAEQLITMAILTWGS